MITGNIGRRGVGVNPLRGQNNVQGAADMGCQPHQGAGYLDAYDPEINKKYEAFYNVKIPLGKGYKIPEMFDASINGKLKALWLMGEDVVQTDPNTNKVIAAMENLDLLVVQELFMTETAKYAHVVLPGASFLEKAAPSPMQNAAFSACKKWWSRCRAPSPTDRIIVDIMNRMGYAQPEYDPKTMLEKFPRLCPFLPACAGMNWATTANNGRCCPMAATRKFCTPIHLSEAKANSTTSISRKARKLNKMAQNTLTSLPPTGNWSTTTPAP
jgi:formate dehydrogenase major subunit